MIIGVAFGLMGAFFTAGMYVAGALGCLSLIVMFFFSDKPLWNQMSADSLAWEHRFHPGRRPSLHTHG